MKFVNLVEVSSEEKISVWPCEYCGHKNPEDVLVCENCGTHQETLVGDAGDRDSEDLFFRRANIPWSV